MLGSTSNHTITIKNTGTAPANVKLVQQGGSFQILTARGAPLRLVHVSDDERFTPASLAGQHGGTGRA